MAVVLTYRMRIILLISCIGLLLLTSCMSHGTRNTLERTEPDKIEHIEAKDVQNQKMIMDEFNILVAQSSSADEIIEFINKNIAHVRPANATHMLIVLEQEQRALHPFADPETIIDYNTIYKPYRGIVTRDMSEYIDLMAGENTAPSDWQDVISRALKQEKFIHDFPESGLLNYMNILHKRYIDYTLYGFGENQLFSKDDRLINSKAYTAFKEAVLSERRSEYLAMLRQFIKVIDENDRRLNEQIKSFREHIKTQSHRSN